MLAMQACNLSSSPGTHVKVAGEDQMPQLTSDLDSHHGTHAPTYTNAHIHTHTHSKNNAKGYKTSPTFKECQGLRPSQKHMLTSPHGKILIHQENVQSHAWTPSTHSAVTENNSKLFSLSVQDHVQK